MHISEVIKRPILTEKSYAQMKDGIYTFAVDKRTNKAEVKKVVEFIFEVKVEKVNIITVSKKPKNLGRFKGFVAGYKKAIVTLKEGSTISMFQEQEVAQPEVKVKETKEKVVSDAEQRAAAKIAAKAKEKEESTSKSEKTTETKKPVAKKETNDTKPAAKKPAAKKTTETKKPAAKKPAAK